MWTHLNTRLQGIGEHTTRIMLKSLSLPDVDIRPVFIPRAYIPMVDRYLTISIGVGIPGHLKQWPLEDWQRLIKSLMIPAVQIGGKQDPLVPGVIDMRGQSLPITAGLLENSHGLICVEGGMAHLAAATLTKSIVMFGPTPLNAYAYPDNINLGGGLCQPCFWGPGWVNDFCVEVYKYCINLPSIDEVLQEADKLCKSA